ncbi:hypothetical protein EMIT0111MI5_250026 [Burkholderia sp. IT-111MI5]
MHLIGHVMSRSSLGRASRHYHYSNIQTNRPAAGSGSLGARGAHAARAECFTIATSVASPGERGMGKHPVGRTIHPATSSAK